MPTSLTISAPVGHGHILVTGSGLWRPDLIDRHFQNLDGALRIMRARRGAARVLVDLSKAMVQTVEVAAKMNDWTARIYREQDRVAVICATQLLAIQIKRTPKVYGLRTFLERDEALDWLLSNAPVKVALPA